jgi:hypothetical protein
MAKWYLYPDAEEFSSWSPRRINRHVKPSSVPTVEPVAALTLTAVGKALLPLTDAGPSPAAGQQVASRTITVDLEAGTATAEYTYEAQPLTALKALKIAAIKQIGPTRIAEGFKYTVPGGSQHTYQVDLESQAHMLAVYVEHLDGKTSPHGGYWRDILNVNVAMTDAENKAFLEAAKAYKMSIIRRAQVLVDAVVAAEDATELALIDPVTGSIDGVGSWPANGA